MLAVDLSDHLFDPLIGIDHIIDDAQHLPSSALFAIPDAPRDALFHDRILHLVVHQPLIQYRNDGVFKTWHRVDCLERIIHCIKYFLFIFVKMLCEQYVDIIFSRDSPVIGPNIVKQRLELIHQAYCILISRLQSLIDILRILRRVGQRRIGRVDVAVVLPHPLL